MSIIWSKVENFSKKLIETISSSGCPVFEDKLTKFNWQNHIFQSVKYRRAHIEIVDHRESHGLYILHTTIFPHFNDSAPIWGFDAVCGRNKISGAFHDFSPMGDHSHYMYDWWTNESAKFNWNKVRELPDWGKKIFSPSMVAIGNIQTELELDNLLALGQRSLEYYLNYVGLTQESGADFHMAQNRYCYYQKKNPHVVRSMVNMGIDQKIMEEFVETVLFPETV
jgi:hypothetical protein